MLGFFFLVSFCSQVVLACFFCLSLSEDTLFCSQSANCFSSFQNKTKPKLTSIFEGKLSVFSVPKKNFNSEAKYFFVPSQKVDYILRGGRLEKLEFSFIQRDSWQLLIYTLLTKNNLNCSFFCFLGRTDQHEANLTLINSFFFYSPRMF